MAVLSTDGLCHEAREGVLRVSLKLADHLKLPLEAATETFAILGRRGSGKTHTAVVMAEEMLAAGVQVVVIDPLDVWWGLRVSKDGKSAGIPIYVAGGAHQDIPLVPDAGKVMADVVVDKGLSVVLSLRHLSKDAQRRFVGDFGERLYDRKGEDQHRTALHVFIDEADAFVPQRLMPGSERCFGAVDTMVRRGRSSGIAPTLISQRPQVINKDVLSQTEVLVAHQLTGPQDRKALEAWIEAHDTDNQRAEFMASLASLPKGTAWFWSPGMLDVFRKVAIRDRRTFDSSATPNAKGAVAAKPKAFAPVDLDAITADIQATIEKAKADDPRELRKQIAELQRQIKAKQIAPGQKVTDPPRVIEKPVITDAQLARAEKLVQGLYHVIAKAAETVNGRLAAAQEVADTIATALKSVRQPAPAAERPRNATQTPSRAPSPRPQAPSSRVNGSGAAHEGITPAKQKILNGLGFLAGIGVAAADKTQLALIVGVSPTSGGYFNNLGALRSSGLIEYPAGGTVALTAAGQALASMDGVPSTTEELHEAIRHKLPPAKWKILEALIGAYPHSLTKDDLATRIEVSPTSGGYFNNLGSLRSLGLISYPRPAEVAALPVLFLDR